MRTAEDLDLPPIWIESEHFRSAFFKSRSVAGVVWGSLRWSVVVGRHMSPSVGTETTKFIISTEIYIFFGLLRSESASIWGCRVLLTYYVLNQVIYCKSVPGIIWDRQHVPKFMCNENIPMFYVLLIQASPPTTTAAFSWAASAFLSAFCVLHSCSNFWRNLSNFILRRNCAGVPFGSLHQCRPKRPGIPQL